MSDDEAKIEVGGDILPTVVTPQVLRNKMDEVNGYADQLQNQAAPFAGKNLALFAAWMQDYSAWKKFYSDNLGTIWGAKGVLEQTEGWQLRLQEWRKKLEAAGFVIQAVEPAAPDKPADIGQALGFGTILLIVTGLYLLTRNK